jgi:hypothetical protein
MKNMNATQKFFYRRVFVCVAFPTSGTHIRVNDVISVTCDHFWGRRRATSRHKLASFTMASPTSQQQQQPQNSVELNVFVEDMLQQMVR